MERGKAVGICGCIYMYIPRLSVNLACGFCVEFSTARFPISTKTSRRGAYPGILHIVIDYLH
jgi:hypothetical protein